MNSDSIKTLFEKGKEALPGYVPAFPSLKLGLLVGAIVFLLGLSAALTDRYMTKDSNDIIEKTRWLFVLAITVYVAVIVTDFIRDQHYAYVSLVTNKQHYANIAWLKQYIRALS